MRMLVIQLLLCTKYSRAAENRRPSRRYLLLRGSRTSALPALPALPA
jgi:hypothetical protein